MPFQEPAQSERKRVREEPHQEARVGQSSAAQRCPRAEMPSSLLDLSLSPAQAARDGGEEKQHGEKGKQWHPRSVALTARAKALPSALSGRKHSFEQKWSRKHLSFSTWLATGICPAL